MKVDIPLMYRQALLKVGTYLLQLGLQLKHTAVERQLCPLQIFGSRQAGRLLRNLNTTFKSCVENDSTMSNLVWEREIRIQISK